MSSRIHLNNHKRLLLNSSDELRMVSRSGRLNTSNTSPEPVSNRLASIPEDILVIFNYIFMPHHIGT